MSCSRCRSGMDILWFTLSQVTSPMDRDAKINTKIHKDLFESTSVSISRNSTMRQVA